MIIIFVLFLILLVKLKTRIDKSGISARFGKGNLFYRKYNWNEITDCFVREYHPLTEYGGWGIRGLGKAKAYNTSGNYGIQIVTHTGDRFLIGTQKPGQVKEILKYYRVVVHLNKPT